MDITERSTPKDRAAIIQILRNIRAYAQVHGYILDREGYGICGAVRDHLEWGSAQRYGRTLVFNEALRRVCARRHVDRYYPIERSVGKFMMAGKWEGRRLKARIRLIDDIIKEIQSWTR